jgi:hypothetical protein
MPKRSRTSKQKLRQKQFTKQRNIRKMNLPKEPYAYGAEGTAFADNLWSADEMSRLMPSQEAMLPELIEAMSDSSAWLDEPEFADIELNPYEVSEIFAQELEKAGLADENPEEMDDDPRMDDVLTNVAKRVLTNELKGEITEAIHAMAERWMRKGRKQQSMRAYLLANALLMADDVDDMDEIWLVLPLVSEMIQRALNVVFQATTMLDEFPLAKDMSVGELETVLGDTGKKESFFVRALKKIPGVAKFFDNELDRHWAEGKQALFLGKLNLGLFTTDELVGLGEVIAVYVESLGEKGDEAISAKEAEQQQQTINNLVEAAKGYLDNLLADEARVARLKSVIVDRANRGTVKDPYTTFLLILKEYQDGDWGEEGHRMPPILQLAIMGEYYAGGWAKDELAIGEHGEEVG